MSKIMWPALAACALASGAAAQEPRAWQARLTRLERALVQAEDAVRRIDSLERGRSDPVDTVTVGALQVVAPLPLVPAARAAAGRVWALVDSAFGRSAARIAGQQFILVDMRRNVPRATPPGAVLTTGAEPDIILRLLWSVATAIHAHTDRALAEWMGVALIPERDPAREPRGVYLSLVTAPSPAARRCFERDVAACRVALGFVPVSEAITDWYDADRRRIIVAAIENLEHVQSMRGAARACIEQHSDLDCAAILRRVPGTAVPRPVSAAARLSLVRHALLLGGREAHARLLAGAGAGRSIEHRLAAASGVSADSLLRSWHASILAARPRPVTVDPHAAWMALCWGIAFGLLALRSSRWR